MGLSLSSCPFQHPFYFLDEPVLQPVLDEFGEALADQVGGGQNRTLYNMCSKVWIQFGEINNIKCVDYFRVTYTKVSETDQEADRDFYFRLTRPE